jgi:hypothetical protein
VGDADGATDMGVSLKIVDTLIGTYSHHLSSSTAANNPHLDDTAAVVARSKKCSLSSYGGHSMKDT